MCNLRHGGVLIHNNSIYNEKGTNLQADITFFLPEYSSHSNLHKLTYIQSVIILQTVKNQFEKCMFIIYRHLNDLIKYFI